MKKQMILMAAVAMLAAAASGRAQTVDLTNAEVIVTHGPFPVTLDVTLSTGTKTNLTNLLFARVESVSGVDSGLVADAIGTTSILGVSTGIVSGVTNIFHVVLSTNVFMLSDVPIEVGKGKVVEALGERPEFGHGPAGMTDSVWLATLTLSDSGKSTNVSAAVAGVWEAGASAFTGKINFEKVK